jgi:hypothetical protein
VQARWGRWGKETGEERGDWREMQAATSFVFFFTVWLGK